MKRARIFTFPERTLPVLLNFTWFLNRFFYLTRNFDKFWGVLLFIITPYTPFSAHLSNFQAGQRESFDVCDLEAMLNTKYFRL